MHRPVLILASAWVWLSACGADGPPKPPTIKDGVRLNYSIDAASPAAAATVINRRLARAKIKGWASAQGDQVVVDLAGDDAEARSRAQDLIARTARLQIRRVDDGTPLMLGLTDAVLRDVNAPAAGIDAADDDWQVAGEVHVDPYLRAIDGEETVDGATARRLGCFRGTTGPGDQVRCRITGRDRLERYVAAAAQIDPALKLADDHQLAYQRVASPDRPPYWRTYYVARGLELPNQAVAEARPFADPDTGRPSVQLTLTADGTRVFALLTRAGVGHKLALILDDRVINAPVVMAPITNGRVVLILDGDRAEADARELATVLASGPLPGPVVLESVAVLKDGRVVAPPPE